MSAETAEKPKAKKVVAKVKKAKAPSGAHPKYLEMVTSAIGVLKERNGSSRQAIHKYILTNFDVGHDPKSVNTHLKMALKRGSATGALRHVKGQGASGSFRLADSAAKKSAAVKPQKAKAPAKPKTEKKETKHKSPAKSPAKKAATKAKKTPTKVVKKSKRAPTSPPAAGGDAKKAPAELKPKKKAAAKPKSPKGKPAKKTPARKAPAAKPKSPKKKTSVKKETKSKKK